MLLFVRVLRLLRIARPGLGIAAALTALGSGTAGAQLRPLDPVDWREVGFEGTLFSVGGGVYGGQRASLAGTKGLLVEVGSFRATWGLGRVSLELAGTALRVFEERSVYSTPAPDVVPSESTRRIDAGDHRVSTLVTLTPGEGSAGLALRFGARLPTTDNLQGLERDQTDFFALLVGGLDATKARVSGELGIGVFGTRDALNEQVDVLLYGLSAHHAVGRAELVLALAGQYDTRSSPEWRGNENLGEARLAVRFGEARWVTVGMVRGWTPHSPDLGATVQIGMRF